VERSGIRAQPIGQASRREPQTLGAILIKKPFHQ
jgi:hypothetical protein